MMHFCIPKYFPNYIFQLIIGFLLISGLSIVQADPIPKGFYSKNFDVVGYSKVNERPAFKITVKESNGKWYLYLGHFWDSGWTIMDVTNPKDPQVVKYISGPPNTWTLQVDLAEDTLITALEKIPKVWGGDPSKPNEEGVLVWSLKDPINPVQLGQFKTGGTGTHRNGYQGGKYMHLAAGMPGFDGNIYTIVDISDKANPKEVGRWWIPGQNKIAGEKYAADVSDKPSLHGPPVIKGNLAFLSYGSAGMVILDISDVTKPVLVSRLSFSPPFLDNIGVHTVVPDMDRKVAFVNSEAIQNQCHEALNQGSVVDISDIKNPKLISMFPLPIVPKGFPVKNFCDLGGRFGPHNQNQLFHNPNVKPLGNLIYLTYFNAGLRVIDVSDVRAPQEVGYFIPPQPTKRYGPVPVDRLVAQSEDVLVDSRGYAYLTHKNQGLWILKFKDNSSAK